MRNVIFLFAFVLSISACKQSANNESIAISEDEIFSNTTVAVYYFHGKMRCVTCNELERISKEVVSEYFSNNDKVKFFSIDFSERDNKAISDKYEIAFSSLIIATENEHTDLSMEAFQLVLSEPSELKEQIIIEVNNYLEN